MPIFSYKHVLFSRTLRFAVSADRIRLVFFCVRRAFLPVENIIGTEVNQLSVFFVADFGKNTRRLRVNPKRAIALGLATIDVRERCRVNQHIESCGAHFLAQILQIRKIKLRMIEARDIVFRSEFPHERGAESPAHAENYNFHWASTCDLTRLRLRSSYSARQSPVPRHASGTSAQFQWTPPNAPHLPDAAHPMCRAASEMTALPGSESMGLIEGVPIHQESRALS